MANDVFNAVNAGLTPGWTPDALGLANGARTSRLGSGSTPDDRAEVRRLAEQFEAMLMTQMMRDMRRSMLDAEEQEPGLGASALTDTGDIEFGLAMSRAGGVGLTSQLLNVLERQASEDTRRAGPKGNPSAAD